MEELIEKVKEYKIIVICVSLGLVLGGFSCLTQLGKHLPRKVICKRKLQLFLRI